MLNTIGAARWNLNFVNCYQIALKETRYSSTSGPNCWVFCPQKAEFFFSCEKKNPSGVLFGGLPCFEKIRHFFLRRQDRLQVNKASVARQLLRVASRWQVESRLSDIIQIAVVRTLMVKCSIDWGNFWHLVVGNQSFSWVESGHMYLVAWELIDGFDQN